MSLGVLYPVEIKAYQVSVNRDGAYIELEGIENVPSEVKRVGLITFGDPDHLVSDKDFINRGGFLDMARSINMLTGILDLLRHEEPLFLHGNGTLSTSLEPVGRETRPA